MTTAVSTTAGALSSAPSTPVNPKSSMGKDEFLKLLVAQMKNQDPMNPSGGDQMAAQLAQFSSLEQLTNISTQLESQSTSNQSIVSMLGMGNAASLIGRTVTASGNGVVVNGGNGAITADIGGSGSGTLHIMDARGREIASRDIGHVNPGRNTIALGDMATDLPDGGYTYRLDVTDAKGNAMTVKPYTTARIDGLRIDANGPVLLSNGMDIPFVNLVQVISNS